jgi:hypothetical protein
MSLRIMFPKKDRTITVEANVLAFPVGCVADTSIVSVTGHLSNTSIQGTPAGPFHDPKNKNKNHWVVFFQLPAGSLSEGQTGSFKATVTGHGADNSITEDVTFSLQCVRLRAPGATSKKMARPTKAAQQSARAATTADEGSDSGCEEDQGSAASARKVGPPPDSLTASLTITWPPSGAPISDSAAYFTPFGSMQGCTLQGGFPTMQQASGDPQQVGLIYVNPQPAQGIWSALFDNVPPDTPAGNTYTLQIQSKGGITTQSTGLQN